MGFNYLCIFKIFFNGNRYLYLCNDSKWLEYCVRYIQDNETYLSQEAKYAKENEYHILLWPTVIYDELLQGLYNFDIWNGISIFKKSKNYVEIWGFATSRDKPQISNFYINKIELLKSFTRFFNESGKKIIDCQDTSKLAIYTNMQQTNIFDFEDPYDMKEINKFIASTIPQKYPILSPYGEVFLSPREKQCLNLMSFGKTAKEAALELNISSKTVELYMKNIKQKTQTHNKADLIKMFKYSTQQWF